MPLDKNATWLRTVSGIVRANGRVFHEVSDMSSLRIVDLILFAESLLGFSHIDAICKSISRLIEKGY